VRQIQSIQTGVKASPPRPSNLCSPFAALLIAAHLCPRPGAVVFKTATKQTRFMALLQNNPGELAPEQ